MTFSQYHKYFILPEESIFPHPDCSDDDGVLALGGDLSPQRLLTAYSAGIFPWYGEGDPIIWWSPDPRFVVRPGEVKISKSMRSSLRKYELRIDTAFEDVIRNCKQVYREGQDHGGNWIHDEMELAYTELHKMGYAHSFECWFEDELIGGLYGLSLGRMFFGESMFSFKSNASKFAFIRLSEILKEQDFLLIDSQVPNDHLVRMGCVEMPRKEYLSILRKNYFLPSIVGSWEELIK